jgi:hypothetical protein
VQATGLPKPTTTTERAKRGQKAALDAQTEARPKESHEKSTQAPRGVQIFRRQMQVWFEQGLDIDRHNWGRLVQPGLQLGQQGTSLWVIAQFFDSACGVGLLESQAATPPSEQTPLKACQFGSG